MQYAGLLAMFALFAMQIHYSKCRVYMPGIQTSDPDKTSGVQLYFFIGRMQNLTLAVRG